MTKWRLTSIALALIALCSLWWVITQFAQRGQCIGNFAYNPNPTIPETDFSALAEISPENAYRLTHLGSVTGSLGDQMGTNKGSGVRLSPDGQQIAVSNYTTFHGNFEATQIFKVSQYSLECTVSIAAGLNSPYAFPSPYFVAFSQSGDVFITLHGHGEWRRYAVWVLEEGVFFPMAVLAFDAEYAEFVRYPDDEYVSYIPVGDTERALWSTTARQTVTHVPYLLSQARAFSADHAMFVTTSGTDGIVVWDYQTQWQRLSIETLPNEQEGIVPVRNVSFAGDNRWLVVEVIGQPIQIWDIEDEQRQLEVQGCLDLILFSSGDQMLCLRGRDLWDIADGSAVQLLSDDESLLALNSEDRLFVATDKGEARLYDLGSRE